MGQANSAKAEESLKSLAVLPFAMHAPSSMAYLQEGLRDMLASRLAANGGAVIIATAAQSLLRTAESMPCWRNRARICNHRRPPAWHSSWGQTILSAAA
jgi:hypothetical protein